MFIWHQAHYLQLFTQQVPLNVLWPKKLQEWPLLKSENVCCHWDNTNQIFKQFRRAKSAFFQIADSSSFWGPLHDQNVKVMNWKGVFLYLECLMSKLVNPIFVQDFSPPPGKKIKGRKSTFCLNYIVSIKFISAKIFLLQYIDQNFWPNFDLAPEITLNFGIKILKYTFSKVFVKKIPTWPWVQKIIGDLSIAAIKNKPQGTLKKSVWFLENKLKFQSKKTFLWKKMLQNFIKKSK